MNYAAEGRYIFDEAEIEFSGQLNIEGTAVEGTLVDFWKDQRLATDASGIYKQAGLEPTLAIARKAPNVNNFLHLLEPENNVEEIEGTYRGVVTAGEQEILIDRRYDPKTKMRLRQDLDPADDGYLELELTQI
ncbi:MAG: hypothetical protein H8Z69_00195 [Nanohaloarchaea archaeon]|nr:hypothetical protein [Candidatus Nanohaloarchaea archaeon]